MTTTGHIYKRREGYYGTTNVQTIDDDNCDFRPTRNRVHSFTTESETTGLLNRRYTNLDLRDFTTSSSTSATDNYLANMEHSEAVDRSTAISRDGTLYSSSEETEDVVDKDATEAYKLGDMGYKAELRRDFSVWSILAVGFSLTNSWFGISASLVTGIYSGGTVVVVYGICFMALISSCIGMSLSELASAMPSAGGQYYWTLKLAPKKYANVLAYITGMLAWLGSVFTSASISVAVGSAFVGVYQMANPEYTIDGRWQVFVAYQCVNLFAFVFNCYGKVLPKIASAAFYCSLVSFIVITVTMLARSSPKNSAKFVFATFENQTGWQSPFIAFVVGLINPNWSFACLDAATHLAEEVHRPERMIPIAIMGTVAIGFVTAFIFSISMFFSIQNIEAVLNTPTGVPILEIFHQGLRSTACAICLEFLIILTGLGCQISCHTWQARLAWSFARDRGLPGSRYWSHVSPGLDVPIYAHAASCLLVAILGVLYIGSYTAFNSMVAACIVMLYISYSIPIACLLFHKGRSNLVHGPFWVGKLGLFANVVLLFWTAFTLVMYSFPYSIPVTASNMNYVSVVYAVGSLLMMLYWICRGRYTFRIWDEKHPCMEEEEMPVPVPPPRPARWTPEPDIGVAVSR